MKIPNTMLLIVVALCSYAAAGSLYARGIGMKLVTPTVLLMNLEPLVGQTTFNILNECIQASACWN